jgi:hypothetical protein
MKILRGKRNIITSSRKDFIRDKKYYYFFADFVVAESTLFYFYAHYFLQILEIIWARTACNLLMFFLQFT